MPAPLPEAYARDADQCICKACGAQYSAPRAAPPDSCAVCLDERQFVPPAGQAWTSLRELHAQDTSTELVPDPVDARVLRVSNKPGVGISQTPIVLRMPRGMLMWDCTAYISPACIAEIRALCTPDTPFLGIAISHPHFYNASASIFRALVDDTGDGCVAPDARIFVSARDREWWMRTDENGLRDVLFVEEDVRGLGEGLTFLRCGGHFPGSAVLHWDRAAGADPTYSGPTSGLLLVADTVMVAPDRSTVSFMFSVPNLLPLAPREVAAVVRPLREYAFGDVFSAWPGREIRGDGKEKVFEGARRFVGLEGWDATEFDI